MPFVRWLLMLFAGEMMERMGISPRRSCILGCLFLVPVAVISLFILTLLTTWEQRMYFCGAVFILLIVVGVWQAGQTRRRFMNRLDDNFPNFRRRR